MVPAIHMMNDQYDTIPDGSQPYMLRRTIPSPPSVLLILFYSIIILSPPFSTGELTPAGKVLAESVGRRHLKAKQIKRVICSPFLRCIQTAAAAMKGIGLGVESLTVSADFCEHMATRNLPGEVTGGGGVRMRMREGVRAEWTWIGDLSCVTSVLVVI